MDGMESIVLRDESESSRLRFDSHDDALDFARHCTENSRRWLAANSFDFVKRYADGQIYIVLRLRSRAGNGVYDLVFSAIPHGNGNAAVASPIDGNVQAAGGKTGRNKQPMLVDVVGLVECPDKIIPSLVRLELPKKRRDIVRDVLASAGDNCIEIRCVFSDGKIGASGVDSPGRNSNGISRLIKRRPEVFDGIGSDLSETVRNCGCEFDLVQMVNASRVQLNSMGAWFSFKEIIDLPVEVVNMSLCALDSTF